MSAQISKRDQDILRFLKTLTEDHSLAWLLDFETQHESAASMADLLEDWFGYEDWNSAGDEFIQIGVDGSGSMFCLWFYPDLDGNPPVVFIGSEGERDLVATNLSEFLVRLVSGRVYEGGEWVLPAETAIEEVEVNWPELRSKVTVLLGKAEFGPQAYAAEASRHPDFKAWVEEREQD